MGPGTGPVSDMGRLGSLGDRGDPGEGGCRSGCVGKSVSFTPDTVSGSRPRYLIHSSIGYQWFYCRVSLIHLSTEIAGSNKITRVFNEIRT